MRQRKFTFLLVTLLVASGLLFAGGEARAATVALNYLVNLDSFTPDLVNGGGTYTYTFTGSAGTGSPSIATIEFEIPAEINISTSTVQVTALTNLSTTTPTSLPIPTVTVFAQGQGDTVLKLGVEDMRYRVLKFSSTQYPFKFTLAFKILASAVPAGKKLVAASQVVLVASTAGVTDVGVVDAPSVLDVPGPFVIIDSLYPDNFVMTSGGMKPQPCATLTWHSTNATSFTIFATTFAPTGVISTEPVAASSPATVCPPVPAQCLDPDPNKCVRVETTYTVTANGSPGTTPARDNATLTVLPYSTINQTALQLNADPPVISLGQCSRLTWKTTPDTTFAFISNINGGSVNPQPTPTDCVVVCPVDEITTYRLTAMKWNGSTEFTERNVILTAPLDTPAPQTIQDLKFMDIPPYTPTTGTGLGAVAASTDSVPITFKVIRNPVFGYIVTVYVCGDGDYNASHSGRCNLRPGLPPDCCELGGPPPGVEVIGNCSNLTGTGLQECAISGAGSPHFKQITSTGPPRYYAFCRSGETALKDASGTVTECCVTGADPLHPGISGTSCGTTGLVHLIGGTLDPP